MPKRSSYEIKEKILLYVKEKPATYAQLERKVNTGFRTIIANVKELINFGLLEVEYLNNHPKNAHVYHLVKITPQGIQTLQNKKNRKSQNQ